MIKPLSIGQLATRTGVKVPTIRYYESIGLLPPAPRTASDRRLYDAQTERRLSFIRHARELGFAVEAIRVFLDLATQPDRSCEEANAIAAAQLVDVERRIEQLSLLRDELTRMSEACTGGTVAECRVIESLADHGLCLSDQHAAAADPTANLNGAVSKGVVRPKVRAKQTA